MKKLGVLIVTLTTMVSLSGCEKIKEMIGGMGGGSSPEAVADQFWNATKTGKPESIKPFVTQASLVHEIMKGESKKTEGEYTLGKATINDNKATIPTHLKDGSMNVDLQTILIKEHDGWKVDVEQTMMTMFGGAMGDMMKGLEDLGKQLGEGLKELGQGMEEETAEITPPAQTETGGNTSHKPGDKVLVEWHGTWYPSTILDCGKTTCKIHYDGWSSSWDERVTFDRIRGE